MDDYESLSSSESRELCGIAYARVMTRLRDRLRFLSLSIRDTHVPLAGDCEQLSVLERGCYDPSSARWVSARVGIHRSIAQSGHYACIRYTA
jgi:hypothetical protein